MLREFERLRSLPDDIENFRKSAELENDYMAMLEGGNAASLLQRTPGAFLESHFGGLALHRWATSDRPAAAAWMATHPGKAAALARSLAGGWLAEDPRGLRTYLAQLPDGAWKDRVTIVAAEDALTDRSPQDSIGFLGRIQGSNARRDELRCWAVTAWAKDDPDAAFRWAGQASDDASRQKLLAAAVIGKANNDPQAAAQLAADYLTDERAISDAVTAIARFWAAKDAPAAAQWINRFSPGPCRDQVVQNFLQVWVDRDPGQATAWVRTIADPDLKERARDCVAGLRGETSVVSSSH